MRILKKKKKIFFGVWCSDIKEELSLFNVAIYVRATQSELGLFLVITASNNMHNIKASPQCTYYTI